MSGGRTLAGAAALSSQSTYVHVMLLYELCIGLPLLTHSLTHYGGIFIICPFVRVCTNAYRFSPLGSHYTEDIVHFALRGFWRSSFGFDRRRGSAQWWLARLTSSSVDRTRGVKNRVFWKERQLEERVKISIVSFKKRGEFCIKRKFDGRIFIDRCLFSRWLWVN